MNSPTPSRAIIIENIVKAWRTGMDQTLYGIIDLTSYGTITIRKPIMETTYNPHGSELSLRKFLLSYI